MPRALLVAAVACGMLVAACGGAATTGQGGRDTGSDPSAAGPSQGGGDTDRLGFAVPAVDGGTVRGADYVGDALAIWFWAPW